MIYFTLISDAFFSLSLFHCSLHQPHFMYTSGGAVVKKPSANAEDEGSIPRMGRSSREGNGNPLQCSCLQNSMQRGTWKATVHRS